MTTSAQLRRTFDNLANVPAEAIAEAADFVESSARRHGGTVTLGKANRRRTYRLRAITKQRRSGDVLTATVYGTPTGPWVWKNTGTRGHGIPRYGNMARIGGYLAGGLDHPVRIPVSHPGTGGRGAWRRVRAEAEQAVPDIFARHVDKALAGVQ